MGCDIHVYFERRDTNGAWQALWDGGLHPEWWWERIAERMIRNGNIPLMTGSHDHATNDDYVERHFKAMSLTEAVEKHDHDADAVRNWALPALDGSRWSEISGRDYGWFARIAGVRDMADRALWEPRGLPEDLSPRVANEAAIWEGDAHSHSWLLVDEMLAQPSLADRVQVKWLRAFIEDPSNTRMVFWFDN